MILDSSVVVAILHQETDSRILSERIESASFCRISAANYLESAIVIDARRDAILSREFDAFFVGGGVEICPLDETQARIAREAYRDFGRGSGHPAKLNFGDCFAYALAKAKNEPLLFKGGDFAHTDVRPALAR
jgi:ribonuclease VapC